jgi:hypothetical protein
MIQLINLIFDLVLEMILNPGKNFGKIQFISNSNEIYFFSDDISILNL